MTASRRQQVLEAFRDRLNTIQAGDAFQTSAGEHVTLGYVPEFGPDDPDIGVAIVVGDDQNGWQGKKLATAVPIVIHALAKVALDEPWIAVEQVLSDIKRAVEIEDWTYGGLMRERLLRGTTRTSSREPGSTTVGLTITYVAPITEVWGAPEI